MALDDQRALQQINDEERREEASRISGNYLPVKDETAPPYTPFYVVVSGQIQSGTMNDHDGVCCNFDFVAGTDWQVHSVSLFGALICNRATKLE